MKHRRGQTLLELVIASGVISVSVVAALTLILRTITLAQQSQQTVEAGNYAREGAEIVRMIRDSNWLAIDDNEQACGALVAWDSDGNRSVCATLAGEYIASFEPTTGWMLVPCNGGTCSAAEQTLYRSKTAPEYTTQSTTALRASFFTQLPYRRVIKISKQTTPVAIPPGAATPPTVEYLDITVEVAWTGLNPRTTTFKEQLYQWR